MNNILHKHDVNFIWDHTKYIHWSKATTNIQCSKLFRWINNNLSFNISFDKFFHHLKSFCNWHFLTWFKYLLFLNLNEISPTVFFMETQSWIENNELRFNSFLFISWWSAHVVIAIYVNANYDNCCNSTSWKPWGMTNCYRYWLLFILFNHKQL